MSFTGLAYGVLVVVVLGFELYLQFKLRFKPSEYLYLRTSSKTKDRHLGLLQSLLAFHLVLYHSLAKRPCQCSILQGKPSVIVPCARIKKCPCALSAKWHYDLVPSRLVSCALLSPTCSTTSHICLSQAYGCSDRYTGAWIALTILERPQGWHAVVIHCSLDPNVCAIIQKEEWNISMRFWWLSCWRSCNDPYPYSLRNFGMVPGQHHYVARPLAFDTPTDMLLQTCSRGILVLTLPSSPTRPPVCSLFLAR